MDRAALARQQFISYRESGHPEALAVVFDLCAQELLLVAHHVARAGVSPQDLLQSTFLVAMRTADRFAADRPLMPWLCGILANVARNQNRTVVRAADVQRLPFARSEDPVERAAVCELMDALRVALEEVPGRQREVLSLRLIHGLTPTEIAHALDEPVGTVKSWLHRGVERLRRLLPAGFAASLVAIITAERALAGVRGTILAAARASAPISSVGRASGPGGGTVTTASRLTISTSIGAALVLVCGLFAWLGSGSEPAPVAAAIGPGAAQFLRQNAAPLPLARREVRDRESTPPPRTTRLRVEGRHTEDGAPARFTFSLVPRFGIEPAFRCVSARTNADGVVVLEDLAPGAYELRPDRAEPRVIEVRPGDGTIVIALPARVCVEGRVVDGFGRAVARAGLWLSSADEITAGMIAAFTDDDGRFMVRDVPANRALAAVAGGFAPTPLRAIPGGTAADAARSTLNLDFTLAEPTPPAELWVVDESGHPLPGALVQIGASARWSEGSMSTVHALHPALRYITGEDGRVVVRAIPPGTTRLWVRAAGTTPWRGVLEHPRRGGEPVVIRLSRGGSCVGRIEAPVRDRAGTRIASDVRTEVGSPADDVPPDFAAPVAFADAAGSFRLDGLCPGEHTLRASHEELGTETRRVTIVDGETLTWSPTLATNWSVAGQAIDHDGQPLAGYRVTAFDEDLRYDTAVVAADGRYRIAPLAGRPSTVWLHGPESGYPGTLCHRVLPTSSPADDVVLRVPAHRRPSAYVRVRVFDEAWRPVHDVRLTSAADGTIVTGPCDADGWTTFGPVPPAAYYLTAAGEKSVRLMHGPITLAADEIGTIDDVHIRSPGHVRARISGRDRSAASRVPAALITPDGTTMVTFFVIEDGVGTTWGIPPGRYVCHVFTTALAVRPAEVEVVSGSTTEVILARESTREVHVAYRHPELCRGLVLHRRWRNQGAEPWTRLAQRVREATDGRTVTTMRLAHGPQQLEVHTCEGLRAAITFDVLDIDEPQIFEVDLE